MPLKNILLFATAAMGSTLFTRDTRFGCGTEDPPAELMSAAAEANAAEIQARQLTDADVDVEARIASIPINVYLHTIASSQAKLLTDAKLQEQFNVLAADFAPHGFVFNLAQTTKTVNSRWAVNQDELGMKRTLRKGTYKDLNIYFQDPVDSLLGKCTFPTTGALPGSEAFILDGCRVAATTVPGGVAPFNLGKTATHEAGHWFGLFHTFQGGCTGGDQVSDTAAQASASSGCPKGRDSCPSQAGVDPINNFMDYSDDACYEQFTLGQGDRMRTFYDRYRVSA